MTLVQFIRVTYGSTINRQVRRSIVSLFQEEYLVKYLTILQYAIWPKVPRVPKPMPTEEEKHERQQQAKRQLLTNVPGREFPQINKKKQIRDFIRHFF